LRFDEAKAAGHLDPRDPHAEVQHADAGERKA
jgi:hypothetical protein